jgi:hypothetical protein
MTEALMICCYVLAGPIAISATESAKDGDFIELPQGDFEQLSRWKIVREATPEEKVAVNKTAEGIPPAPLDKGEPEPVVAEESGEVGKPVDPLDSAETEAPKETAAQKKKREADEAKAAKQLADKEAAEKLANETKEPAA